jgi:ATP adenylyltransferase
MTTQLWAPWRLDYITAETPDGCIFCVRDCHREDHSRQILARGDHAFVLLNKFPYTNGHLMVAPYRHTADHAELTPEEVLEMHRLLILSRDVLRELLDPQGFNLGMNLGHAAGAGVVDHLHLHLVPRWVGDTNFMPVLGDVRVIPQHLERTYELLAPAFARRCGS